MTGRILSANPESFYLYEPYHRNLFKYSNGSGVERVIGYKRGNKKTVRSRVEDWAVDYWAVHVVEAKNNNKHFTLWLNGSELN